MSRNIQIQNWILTGMSTLVGLMTFAVINKAYQKFVVTPHQVVMTETAPSSVGLTAPIHSISALQKQSKIDHQSQMDAIAIEDTGETMDVEETLLVTELSAETSVQERFRLNGAYSDEAILGSQWIQDPLHFADWSLDFLDEGNIAKYSKGPRLYSRSVFIVDLDSGEVLYEKAPDTRRGAASLTKVLSALTLASMDTVDLHQSVCADHTIRTGISGAVTRVKIGDCATGWDFMGAALVSSDNGAAFSFPLVANQSHEEFAEDMNWMANHLQMTQSEFVDPAGIYDGNISTARDITKMSIAAAFHPLVSIAGSAKQWHAKYSDRELLYYTTNKASGRSEEFLLAKTGYTDTARANFTAVYQEKSGRRIAFTILGAWNTKRRTKDIWAVLDWVRNH